MSSPARPTARHRRSPLLEVVDVLARVGSVVTLAALLVVGGAVGGLFDGTPVNADATVTATFGDR